MNPNPRSTRQAAYRKRLLKERLPKDGRLGEVGRITKNHLGKPVKRLKVARGRPAPAYQIDPRKRAFAVSRPTPKKISVRERLRAALRAAKAKVVGG